MIHVNSASCRYFIRRTVFRSYQQDALCSVRPLTTTRSTSSPSSSQISGGTCGFRWASSVSPSSSPQVLMGKLYIKDHLDDENEQNKENDANVDNQTSDDNNNMANEPYVTKLTLNRPKANAMGKQMIQELSDCLDELEEKEESSGDNTTAVSPQSNGSRCLIITSHSSKVFSAGADLKERSTMTQQEASEFVTLLRNTMERIACLPIPVISAIDGVAVGGGLELALASDIIVASSTATLGLPETSLAIIPGAGGTQRLPRLIGVGRAKELIWTGRKISGEEAYRYGLVQHVVSTPGESVTEYAIKLGFQIAQNGPVAIKASKQAIMEGLQCMNMKDALEIERQCYAKTLPTKDRLEGLAAFKEGRKPKYTGQ